MIAIPSARTPRGSTAVATAAPAKSNGRWNDTLRRASGQASQQVVVEE